MRKIRWLTPNHTFDFFLEMSIIITVRRASPLEPSQGKMTSTWSAGSRTKVKVVAGLTSTRSDL